MSKREGAKKVLADASIALDDWLHQYAGEMCDADKVEQSCIRIGDSGGTLAYIAELQRRIRRVLGIKAKTWGQILQEEATAVNTNVEIDQGNFADDQRQNSRNP